MGVEHEAGAIEGSRTYTAQCRGEKGLPADTSPFLWGKNKYTPSHTCTLTHTHTHTHTYIQQGLQALLVTVVSSPVYRSEAVLVRGGRGATSMQEHLHHVDMATGGSKVDRRATLVIPGRERGSVSRGRWLQIAGSN